MAVPRSAVLKRLQRPEIALYELIQRASHDRELNLQVATAFITFAMLKDTLEPNYLHLLNLSFEETYLALDGKDLNFRFDARVFATGDRAVARSGKRQWRAPAYDCEGRQGSKRAATQHAAICGVCHVLPLPILEMKKARFETHKSHSADVDTYLRTGEDGIRPQIKRDARLSWNVSERQRR